MNEAEIRTRLAELRAKQEASLGWGAAVCARQEEIKELEGQLSSLTVSLPVTEQEYLEDNIATVAFHLGQPGAHLKVNHGSTGIDVSPGAVLAEISRRLGAAQGPNTRVRALEAAALDFIAKVDRGEARSTKSYAAFKAAVALPQQGAVELDAEAKIRAQMRVPLIKVAAECHIKKWQFDTSGDERIPVADARRLVRTAFDVLHNIGDMAHKAAEALRSPAKSPALEPDAVEPRPYCWVIPGDDQASGEGWLDARITEWGEFTQPLYRHPPAPLSALDPATVEACAKIAQHFFDQTNAKHDEIAVSRFAASQIATAIRALLASGASNADTSTARVYAFERAAFIAGYERFPGPTGCWDRDKITERAAEEWELYAASRVPQTVRRSSDE